MNIYNAIVKIVSTFFYVGYLPLIPGTFGSIAGICIFYLIRESGCWYTLFVFILMLAGFLVAGRAEKIMHKKDARCIVIDEVSGMLFALTFIPYDIRLIIIAFLIFRLLDTLKPYPAGALQHLEGSLGIMADDIVAGFYTNIILQAALRLASFKVS